MKSCATDSPTFTITKEAASQEIPARRFGCCTATEVDTPSTTWWPTSTRRTATTPEPPSSPLRTRATRAADRCGTSTTSPSFLRKVARVDSPSTSMAPVFGMRGSSAASGAMQRPSSVTDGCSTACRCASAKALAVLLAPCWWGQRRSLPKPIALGKSWGAACVKPVC